MKKVLIQFDFPNVSSTQYDRVWDDLRAAGHANPKGLIYHVGAKNGSSWAVTDVWESEEAFAKFGEILMPLLEKHDMPKIQPRVLPVHYDYAGKVKATASVA